MGKDESVIPKGPYCYTYKNGKYYCCPYWDMDETKPEQDNGYCSFLEIGDWEEGGSGLLWDQCKECGVNDELD